MGIQDIYMPDPGEVDEADCGICGTRMTVKRNCHGPTSYTMAMAGSGRPHDFFECPHRKEGWHRQVKDLQHYKRKVPSAFAGRLIQEEIDLILQVRQHTKSEYADPNYCAGP